MALEAAFADLTSRLRELRDVLQGLRLTTAEDRPEHGAVVLVETVGDVVENLAGQLEEALQAADKARRAAGPPLDLNRARRYVTVSQEAFHVLLQSFYAEFFSYDRVAPLVQFGKERGREWMAWVESVRHGTERCQPLLEAVTEGYFRCWQEMAERAGSSTVSVQSTSIGQQISAAVPTEKEIEVEGLT
jgi:hypothetical protein